MESQVKFGSPQKISKDSQQGSPKQLKFMGTSLKCKLNNQKKKKKKTLTCILGKPPDHKDIF